jgi:perosamine synthetase
VELAPWLFSITVDSDAFGRSRDQVMADLDARGIETRPFFIPIHTLPPYRDQAAMRGTELPETDRIAASGLNLPTWPGLSDEDISRVCRALLRS